MKNTKSKKTLIGALVILGAMALSGAALANHVDGHPWPPSDGAAPAGTPIHPGPTIYVTSSGANYATVVLGTLPMDGPFQELVPGGPTGLQTAYGPGDPEYLGGRWWIDANPNGYQDDGDIFFMCPLTVEVDI